jgi:hypothetical protein
VDPLLDNARNTHAANNIGTVFSSSADGLLLCKAPAVTSHNSTWPSRDMYLASAVTLCNREQAAFSACPIEGL